jgi:hypothetical protein
VFLSLLAKNDNFPSDRRDLTCSGLFVISETDDICPFNLHGSTLSSSYSKVRLTKIAAGFN